MTSSVPMTVTREGMSNTKEVIQVAFAGAASVIGAFWGFAYHWAKYHTHVEHESMMLPNITALVTALAPWVFLVPLAVLFVGIALRKRPLGVIVTVNLGWLFAISWPLLCVWAWEVPFILL